MRASHQRMCVQTESNALAPDGWLSDDHLVTAVDSDGRLAFARLSTLCMLHIAGDAGTSGMTRTQPALLPGASSTQWSYSTSVAQQCISASAAVPANESISALAWLDVGPTHTTQGSGPVFEGSPSRGQHLTSRVIVLGTTTGHVQLHDQTGQLLHRQRLHGSAITALQAVSARGSSLISASPDEGPGALVATCADAVCVISVASIKSVLRHVYLYISLVRTEGVEGACPPVAYQFQRWTVPWGTKQRCDSVCMPAQLHLWEDLVSLQTPPEQCPQPALAIVSVGSGPAIAFFEARGDDGMPVELPSSKVDIGDAKAQSGFLNSLVNGVAGMVLGKAVDAATEVLGIPVPGCCSYRASIVNAVVGALISSWPGGAAFKLHGLQMHTAIADCLLLMLCTYGTSGEKHQVHLAVMPFTAVKVYGGKQSTF